MRVRWLACFCVGSMADRICKHEVATMWRGWGERLNCRAFLLCTADVTAVEPGPLGV